VRDGGRTAQEIRLRGGGPLRFTCDARTINSDGEIHAAYGRDCPPRRPVSGRADLPEPPSKAAEIALITTAAVEQIMPAHTGRRALERPRSHERSGPVLRSAKNQGGHIAI